MKRRKTPAASREVVPRRHPVPPIYRHIILECERRRQHLDISMERLSEIAGIADRAYAKLLHPDSNTGRMAQWSTLQLVCDVLFADGLDVEIRPRKGRLLDQLSMKYCI